MAFGVYVHIPYCLQRCKYCDFATYQFTDSTDRPHQYSTEGNAPQNKIMPPSDYVDSLREEIRQKAACYARAPLDTLYFGGGTPSLLAPVELGRIIRELRDQGFPLRAGAEVTLEINPATLTRAKLEDYRALGFNRFSVGCQTFDDGLLKTLGREHDAEDTRGTIALLRELGLNYSLDLLFALPRQSFAQLQSDVDEMIRYRPPHVSPYCLTVPEGHVLTPGRPVDEAQVEMFDLIHRCFEGAGYRRYEISNYALPGSESRHNTLYWTDQEYWGLGLSAHSYSKRGDWGARFWNPPGIDAYARLIAKNQGRTFDDPTANLPPENFEVLEARQSLTDFFHTSLRRAEGVDLRNVTAKFGRLGFGQYTPALERLVQRRLLVTERPGHYRLADEGVVLSNEVFRELTFLTLN